LYWVIDLCQKGSFPQALEVLDQRPQPDLRGDIMRVFVLAELPHKPRPTLEDYQKFARTYSPERLPMRAKGVVLLFLGRKQDALEEFRKVRPGFALSQDWREFYEAVHRFNCGELSEEGLLAQAGASRLKQCDAYYATGLFRFASGDRTGAQYHFQKAVGTRAIWLQTWTWSRMFRDRLEKNSKWPPWIPMKESPPELP
jgi:hypothetical protein